MTTEKLQEIKARLNKTTDTIWRTNMHNEILTSNGVRIGQMIRVQDAEFVIHAREDVPALIEEVERLTTESVKLYQALYERDVESVKQEKELKKLHDALEFYANKKTYVADVTNQWQPVIPIDSDRGVIARTALGSEN